MKFKTLNEANTKLYMMLSCEDGIFAGSDKISGLDCISIGPDMDDIHSPKERLSVKSTANVWEFLKEVLK